MRQIKVLAFLWAVSEPLGADTSKSAQRILQFESAVSVESEMGHGMSEALAKVLERLGYDFKATAFPARRGLEEIKTGRIDGTTGRIGDLSAVLGAKDFVRIDVPLLTLKVSRWCRSGADKVYPVKLKVGSRLGSVVVMMLSEKMDLQRISLQEIRDQRSSLQMLSSGRLDCLISNDQVLATDAILPDELKPFERFDLMTVQVYPWLSIRYRELKPALEAGLRAYIFPEGFHKKYQSEPAACDKLFDVLCPDGVIFKEKIDFRLH